MIKSGREEADRTCIHNKAAPNYRGGLVYHLPSTLIAYERY